MALAASVLYDLVQCPERVALDAFGNPSQRDDISPFVRLLWERATIVAQETIAKSGIPFTNLSEIKSSDRERLTVEAMARGDLLIYGGCIGANGLVASPDVLRKESGGYVPGDIKAGRGKDGGSDESDGRPKLHYAIQLAMYVDILERLSFSAGRRAFTWDVHRNEVTYDFDAFSGERFWEEYEAKLAEARAIIAGQVRPLPAHSSVCKLCHWHTLCIAQLAAADDLTLIPFLGRSDRDTMRDDVPTISALAAIDPEAFIKGKKSAFAGIGADRLRLFHARTIMLKSSRPKPYLRSPVVLNLAPCELFFDIEVDPLRDICYLHGFLERHQGDDATERFVPIFAAEPTSTAESDAFAAALDYLAAHDDATIYFYSKYERTIYRKLQEKYPNICTPEDIERIFASPRAVDLYGDVVYRATEWPTRDHSLKTLAKYLGFTWRDKHPSGAASIEWFDRWCQAPSPDIRQRILDYNEDDCRATRVLLDGIRELAA
jgi:predicted RecB family nuclease